MRTVPPPSGASGLGPGQMPTAVSGPASRPQVTSRSRSAIMLCLPRIRPSRRRGPRRRPWARRPTPPGCRSRCRCCGTAGRPGRGGRPHVLVAVHVVVDRRGVPGLHRETTAVLAILVPAGAARLSWSWAAVGLVGVVSALWWADPRRCGGTPSPVGATASRCSSSSSRSPLGCSESSWCWSARVRQGGNGVPVGKRRSTSAEPRRAPRSARPPNDPCDRRARGPRIPAGHVDPESTVRLSARRSSRRPYVSSTQVSR
jgi:hypothetical protein